MSRRRAAEQREIHPDPKYGDTIVTKFTNNLMKEGKKSVAERIVYGAFDVIEKKTRQDPVKVFREAIENVKPAIEVRSRRVGGANYQVPMQVNRKRQQSLAFRWIIGACREASGRPMSTRLADELMAAYKKEGKAIQTRENTHRMADANTAFAHFAW